MAKTVIHQENIALWGDKDHLEVAQSKTFAELIFELLSEREPNPGELEVFELILNLSIDHGPDTPSAAEVIKAAKNGEGISKAISEGLTQIGDIHGGAAEPLMEVLYRVGPLSSAQIKDLGSGSDPKQVVVEYLRKDKKIPGFGHRIYKNKDPRAELILNRLERVGESERFMSILREIQIELEKQTGKFLPINIDGAIAAALCTMGFEPKIGKAVFIIARTPGLIGQYLNNR